MPTVPRRTLWAVAAATVAATTGVVSGTSSAGAEDCFEGDHTRRYIMRGNVNGDEQRDKVWIKARKREGRCRYYLVVDTGTTKHLKRLRGDRFVLRHYARPMALIGLDHEPGREIGVLLAQGASTSGSGLFTMRDGEIKRMPMSGPGSEPDEIFYYGGSVSHQHAVDCRPSRGRGALIYSYAYFRRPTSERYTVERRFFDLDGRTFERTSEPTERDKVRPQNLDRYPEYRNNPWERCPGRVRF